MRSSSSTVPMVTTKLHISSVMSFPQFQINTLNCCVKHSHKWQCHVLHDSHLFSGLLALKRAGFQVEVYYASETDDQAAIICQANHGSAITQLGDVTKITSDMASA